MPLKVNYSCITVFVYSCVVHLLGWTSGLSHDLSHYILNSLIPLSHWQDFHWVHPVNLSIWKETRLKHRWKHWLNFGRFYPPIVEGKHRWTTNGSPVKTQCERLSRWNTRRNANWMSKVMFCFQSYTNVVLVSARSLPLQVGCCASRKHRFTGSILAGMKRIFTRGSPFNSMVVHHWKQHERGISLKANDCDCQKMTWLGSQSCFPNYGLEMFTNKVPVELFMRIRPIYKPSQLQRSGGKNTSLVVLAQECYCLPRMTSEILWFFAHCEIPNSLFSGCRLHEQFSHVWVVNRSNRISVEKLQFNSISSKKELHGVYIFE